MSWFDDGSQISEFLAFTGTQDRERANQYLEMSGGNLEMAVDLFAEHQFQRQQQRQYHQDQLQYQYQQEQQQQRGNEGTNSNSNSNNTDTGNRNIANNRKRRNDDEDKVRAPDPTRSMRLMGDEERPHHLGRMELRREAWDRQIRHLQQPQHMGGLYESKSDDNDDDEYDPMDETADDNDGNHSNERQSKSPSRFSAIFGPPRNLMFLHSNFIEARYEARNRNRWLLVNLQCESEFASLALNRDVWRNEVVEDLVQENFVFWQVRDISDGGCRYTHRYSVKKCPHVGIIDPHTGRLRWRKEGWTQEKPLTAEQFVESVVDFCARHTLGSQPVSPPSDSFESQRQGFSPSHYVPLITDTTKGSAVCRTKYLSEEEQLEAAVKASLEGAAPMDSNSDDNDDAGLKPRATGSKVQVVPSKPRPPTPVPKKLKTCVEAEASSSKPLPRTPTLDELKALDIGDEPNNGAQIRFYLPDGSRKTRKFRYCDSVKFLYAFLAQQSTPTGQEIVLVAGFPQRDLIGEIENSIADSSLSGETVKVRWA